MYFQTGIISPLMVHDKKKIIKINDQGAYPHQNHQGFR